jgi:hypothetical protein
MVDRYVKEVTKIVTLAQEVICGTFFPIMAGSRGFLTFPCLAGLFHQPFNERFQFGRHGLLAHRHRVLPAFLF